ncbi:MAG TPA: TlyA family RNA methyltransferase, partial [Hyphomicrobiaceae bacterium]|nr:TlyA family RNA methyltransferase [Hyphomicrobiaceae bacterium]
MRLDEALVCRQLAPSRSRARALVLAGEVTVNGTVELKASRTVSAAALITLAGRRGRHVSLGGDKLILALDAFGAPFDPSGRSALDIGASTGGFTDVLLSRGAARIHAVDVGRDQLHARLRADPRVVAHESTDCREITADLIPDPIDLIVADVSFISLAKALPAALALARPQACLIALVKPQ